VLGNGETVKLRVESEIPLKLYSKIKTRKGSCVVVFVSCVSAMGWFMSPFAKIQTPWTEQEGKSCSSVVTYGRF
jgi:tellurite resistance protein TehA-like permease